MTNQATATASAKSQSKTPVPRATRGASSTGNSEGSSVFDRLYKTSTASSKTRKTTGPAVNKCILDREGKDGGKNTNARTKPVTRRRPATKKTASNIDQPAYLRLYSKGTASTAAKKVNSDAPSQEVNRSALKPKNVQA